MAKLTYDSPGVFYDAPGVFYDSDTPETPPTTMPSNIIALGLRDRTETEQIALARQIAAGLLEHAADFPSPTPAQITAAADEAETSLALQATIAQDALAATTAKEGKFSVLHGRLTASAGWAEQKIKVPATIEWVYPLAKERETTTEIAQVAALAATFGDDAGELDLVWEPVAKSKSYEIQTKLPAGAWQHAKTTARSKTTLTNQPSAQTIQIRVRAIGPNELEGAWSDIAEHLVP